VSAQHPLKLAGPGARDLKSRVFGNGKRFLKQTALADSRWSLNQGDAPRLSPGARNQLA
jgi:hypothetical protein